jgi:hypothetical protein
METKQESFSATAATLIWTNFESGWMVSSTCVYTLW